MEEAGEYGEGAEEEVKLTEGRRAQAGEKVDKGAFLGGAGAEMGAGTGAVVEALVDLTSGIRKSELGSWIQWVMQQGSLQEVPQAQIRVSFFKRGDDMRERMVPSLLASPALGFWGSGSGRKICDSHNCSCSKVSVRVRECMECIYVTTARMQDWAVRKLYQTYLIVPIRGLIRNTLYLTLTSKRTWMRCKWSGH
jgi:hypothetical protein